MHKFNPTAFRKSITLFICASLAIAYFQTLWRAPMSTIAITSAFAATYIYYDDKK
jgi:hypothetical protein